MFVRPQAREPLVPWVVAALVALAGLGVVAAGSLRLGGYVLAAAFWLAAGMRLVLPRWRAGALGIRGRALDAVMYAGAGAVVAVGTWAINIPPPGA